MSQFVRFFAVTVLGVILDLAIAFALHQWAGVPLWLAAATGFVAKATPSPARMHTSRMTRQATRFLRMA